MGRLPAVVGGRPTVPGTEQAGKATGPFGIAELPKQKNFMIPVVYIDHGFFILVKRSTDYKSHRSALKKYMEGGRAR